MEYKHYIKVADDLVITEAFTIHDFKQTKYYDNQDFSMFFWLDGWFNIEDHIFGVGLFFTDYLINQVQIYGKDDSIGDEVNTKMIFYKNFIEKHSEYGGAIADYDPRSDSADIIVVMQK
jgi:hypothetical protein